jgi:hypothetical protein
LAGFTDGSNIPERFVFRVYADNSVVFQREMGKSETANIDVNIQGARHLKMEIELVGDRQGYCPNCLRACFGDPCVIR